MGLLMFLCLVFFGLLILWFLVWRISNNIAIKLAEKIPGPVGYPVIGNTLELIGSTQDVAKRIYELSKDFPNVMKLWIGSRLLIFLDNPKDIELILGSGVHIVTSNDKSFYAPLHRMAPIVSNSIQWKNHRRGIIPIFEKNTVKTFINLFNTTSKDVITKLSQENKKEFNCYEHLSKATVEMLIKSVAGDNTDKTISTQHNHENAFVTEALCNLLHLKHKTFWARLTYIFNFSTYEKYHQELKNIIKTFTTKVLENKKKAFRTSIITGSTMQTNKSVLDFLTEKSPHVLPNDEIIKEQLNALILEGHDTTVAVVSYFLYMMGLHPDIQEKCVQELQNIFDNSDRFATFEDTMEMKYLERCLLETLRLFPPVPVITREIYQAVNLVTSNLKIPVGSTVVIPIYKIHRSPEFYPNPNKFDPDNFLREHIDQRHEYAFLPFSAGRRACVGNKYAVLKMKILLSTILRNYQVHSSLNGQNYQPLIDFPFQAADTLKIKLEPRYNIYCK